MISHLLVVLRMGAALCGRGLRQTSPAPSPRTRPLCRLAVQQLPRLHHRIERRSTPGQPHQLRRPSHSKRGLDRAPCSAQTARTICTIVRIVLMYNICKVFKTLRYSRQYTLIVHAHLYCSVLIFCSCTLHCTANSNFVPINETILSFVII